MTAVSKIPITIRASVDAPVGWAPVAAAMKSLIREYMEKYILL